jgi:hypothetical protein
MVNAKTMKVEKVSLTDESNMNSLEILYNDFQFVNEDLIPHENAYRIFYKNVKTDASTEMNIAFNRISLDDKKMKFPFNVPNKYVSNE